MSERPLFATVTAIASFSDFVTFGGGPTPSSIVFWIFSNWSFSSNAAVGFAGVTQNPFVAAAWSQSFIPGAGLTPIVFAGGGLTSPPTNGGNTHLAFSWNGAGVFNFGLQVHANVSDILGGGTQTTAVNATVAGIQVLDLSGTDITRQVVLSFGSNTNYHLGTPGGPVSAVPEPQSVALVATGLLVFAIGAWRRRHRSETGAPTR